MKDRRALVLEAPIARALARLAWPIVLSHQLIVFSSAILIFWLGRLLGPDALAVESLFRPIGLFIWWFFQSVSVGASVLVARSVGAKDGAGMRILLQAAILALAMCAPLLVAAPLSRPLAELLVGDLPLGELMRAFLLPWLLAVLPVVSLAELLLDTAKSAGWTMFGLVRVVTNLVLMAALVPVFVDVLGLGISGAPLAEGVGGFVLLGLLWLALTRNRAALGLGDFPRGAAARPDLGLWREILRIGLPVSVARLVAMVVQIVLVQLAARESGAAAAGFGIASVFLLFGAGVGMSVCQAGAIIIGQSLGAQRHERPQQALRAMIGFAVGLGVVFMLVTLADRALIALVTDDVAVQAQAVRALGWVRWSIFGVCASQVVLAAFAAVKASARAGMLAIAGDLIGLVIAYAWPGDSTLEAASVGLVAGSAIKGALLVAVGRAGLGAHLAPRQVVP